MRLIFSSINYIANNAILQCRRFKVIDIITSTTCLYEYFIKSQIAYFVMLQLVAIKLISTS